MVAQSNTSQTCLFLQRLGLEQLGRSLRSKGRKIDSFSFGLVGAHPRAAPNCERRTTFSGPIPHSQQVDGVAMTNTCAFRHQIEALPLALSDHGLDNLEKIPPGIGEEGYAKAHCGYVVRLAGDRHVAVLQFVDDIVNTIDAETRVVPARHIVNV